MKRYLVPLIVLGFILFGCGSDNPVSPPASAPAITASPGSVPNPGRPGYEPAYYDGDVVTINAIEVPPRAPEQAQADFYEVVYPPDWEARGMQPPQCAPCDHEGNGVDFTDFHDHILDSIPRSPRHGEYSPLWHVFVVIPALGSDDAHNQEVLDAYAPMVPATSEEAVEALLDTHLPDGSPVAVEIDTDFYFLCSVVNEHAVP